METELIILGTGNALATKCYNTCFALRQDNEYFLTDAGGGNGIMIQLEKAGIKYRQIHHMFVTHGHTDHVLGTIWVIRRIATCMLSGNYEGNFYIYCHDEVEKIIRTICDFTLGKKMTQFIDRRIIFHVLSDGEEVNILQMRCCFFDIGSTKKKQYGFRTVLPGNISLVCLGDEPYNDICRYYVENCDWLLSEAFCLYKDREKFKPYEKNHSTTLDAGKMAEQLHVRNLLLYHTEDHNLSNRKRSYTEEAKSVFSGQVWVPDDLERISL